MSAPLPALIMSIPPLPQIVSFPPYESIVLFSSSNLRVSLVSLVVIFSI